jgi:8-oxo-dGTP pyrophosphatase MutT (NUDIX family)
MAPQQPVVAEQPAARPIVLAVFTQRLMKELGNVVGIGKVLLGKEKDGAWRFPGGKLQPRELERFHSCQSRSERHGILLKALRREMREELDFHTIQDIHFFAKIPGEGLRSKLPLNAYVYIIHPKGDVSPPQSTTEFIELRWVDDPETLRCQKRGERISPLVCKVLRILRAQGMY